MQLEREHARSLDAETVARRWEAGGREVQARVLACTSRIRAALPHLSVHDAEVIDRELRTALSALSEGGG